MAKLIFWDKQSDLLFPSGYTTAEEQMQKEPWMRHGKVVVEVRHGVVVGMHNLGVLCGNYGVPDDLDDDAALAAVNEAIERRQAEYAEAARVAAETPSNEERIAAALEYQNLMTL